jgi:RNA polymerase sigma-70 factor (ECF subfamily)
MQDPQELAGRAPASVCEQGMVDVRSELAALHAASFGWALACAGRDHERASEVLQHAYWKVLDGRARFVVSGAASFKTWFFGVIRMTALEQRRFFARRITADVPPSSSTPASGPLPDSAAARMQRAERLSRALAQLAPRQREVLHLVFYEDMSIAEAAAVMNVSLGSARQHYDRGKKRLEELLEHP